MRRATSLDTEIFADVLISIHALLAESDLDLYTSDYGKLPFLSTLSLRRATVTARIIDPTYGISIHALLAESDRPATRPARKLSNFYPRSPCGERRLPPMNLCVLTPYFYPRSPCGERLVHQQPVDGDSDFYPRSPCGERQDVVPLKSTLL